MPANSPAGPRLRIVAPSRLHFGLLSFGNSSVRQFGGVGVMVQQPRTSVQFTPASEFRVEEGWVGECRVDERTASRVREFAEVWRRTQGLSRLPACRVQVTATPPAHAGLGTGTQLALSVAAGLFTYSGLPVPEAESLAASVGRGQRSAVGSHGFLCGGLIVERGKYPGEPLSPLDCRLALPPAWRFLLVRPRAEEGLSGSSEQRAFRQLPSVPAPVREELVAELRKEMLPAAAQGDHPRFSASVYRFGRMAGSCFASIQGGPYNGPLLSELVTFIRECGCPGVGQSSWGPTLFAICPSQLAADRLAGQLVQRYGQRLALQTTAVCHQGACIEPLGLDAPRPAGGA